MDTSYQPRCLQRLLETGAEPTLGEIAYASNGDWKWRQKWLAKNQPLDSEQQLWGLWQAYDAAFEKRPDYLLWRNIFRSNHLSNPLDAVRMIECTHNGLESRPLIVWGVLCAAAGLLGSVRKSAALSGDHILELATLCSNRIAGTLAPLKGAECACAGVRLLIHSAIERSWFVGTESKCYNNIEIAGKYLDHIEFLMRQIDPGWQPGLTVTLGRLYQAGRHEGGTTEAKSVGDCDTRPLLSFSTFEFATQLRVVFYRARGVIRNLVSSCPIDQSVMDVLQKAFRYSMSAWLSARSVRIAEEQRLAMRPGWYSKAGLDRLRHEEAKALCRAGLAAKDAGRFSTAATLGHHLLWTVSEDRTSEYWTWFNPNHFAFDVRQLGLEVPPKFCCNKRPPRRGAGGSGNAPLTTLPTVAPDVQPSVPASGALDAFAEQVGPNPLALRMARDQAGSLWAKVVAALPRNVPEEPTKVLGTFVYLACGGKISDPEALRAAFHLCLRYKEIANAGRLLDTHRFALSHVEVMQFAEAINAAGTLLPWAIDVERHRQWQGILRRRWGELGTQVGSVEEAFTIHETLLGRLLTRMRSADSGALAAKYYGTISEAEIRDLYDAGGETRRQGVCSASPSDVRACLRTLQTAELGTPVAISAAWLVDELWSIVALSADGTTIGARISFPQNLRNEARAIASSPDLHLGVPWEDGLLAFGKAICDIAAKCDPGARWILLATEPNVAKLPWQDLLRSCAHGTAPLVSLVPSLTWTAVAAREQNRYPAGSYGRLSTIDKLMEPHRERVLSEQQLAEIEHCYTELLRETGRAVSMMSVGRSSVACVLGHGLWDDTARWVSVVAPDQPMTRHDWSEASERRIVIVHACTGGRVKHQFLGDVGGLAALALGRKARLFASPVAEIPPSTALALQKELVSPGHCTTVGARYLHAVKADPSVALYNLWGFASEQIL